MSMWYFIAAAGGFLLGVVITCVLLCSKNLEAYKQIESSVSSSTKGGLGSAKAMYQAQVDAYENGTSAEDEEI